MSLDVRAIDTGELPKKAAPEVDVGFRVFIDESIFDHTVARGNEDTTREVGGVLLGELLRDASGPYLHVRAVIDALHADEQGTELTFTHETWEHINSELDREHEGAAIVGWWHTHPGFGVFLSDRDEFIHKSFFDLPHQIALVYDPKSREHGVFCWRDNAITRTRRYWVGRHEHVWDGDRRTAAPTDNDGEPRASSSESRQGRDAEPEAWVGTVAVAVIALILGALLGWWFFGGRAAERPSAQIEAAQAIKQLETELVRLWRQTMDEQNVLRELDSAATKLEAAKAALTAKSAAPSAAGGDAGPAAPATPAKPADTKAALAELEAGLSRVKRLRDNYAQASALLAQLAAAGKRQSKRDDVERALMRTVVANLYAELALDAAKTDKRRARRLLINAAQIDPDNHERYEKQLRMFDPKATLPKKDGR